MGGFYEGKGKGKSNSGGGFYGGKGKDTQQAAPAAGPPIPKGLLRKLEALSYPELDSASLQGQDYCKIVLWLEEEKIRLYEKIDRKVLRDFNRSWYTHVQDYAKELGVPAEELSERNVSAKLSVLNGLTNIAVHDIYRDCAEANELTVVPSAKAAEEGEKQRLGVLIPAINRLLDFYSLPTLPEGALDGDTVAALRCVHARVCPPATEMTGTPLDLDRLPTGLAIDDPEVNRAAAVLRLLHGLELQQLQVNINHVINELQSLTADPKTDARLGRVGR